MGIFNNTNTIRIIKQVFQCIGKVMLMAKMVEQWTL